MHFTQSYMNERGGCTNVKSAGDKSTWKSSTQGLYTCIEMYVCMNLDRLTCKIDIYLYNEAIDRILLSKYIKPFCIIRHFILVNLLHLHARWDTLCNCFIQGKFRINIPLLSPNSSRHFLMFKNLNALQYRLLVSIWMSREVCQVGTVTDCCFELELTTVSR